MSEYNLKQSLAKVGQLYPVLVASDGEIIDGHHRLRARDDWQRIKLPHIKSNAEKYAARIIANLCRRDVSKKEKREWVSLGVEELIPARSFKKSHK